MGLQMGSWIYQNGGSGWGWGWGWGSVTCGAVDEKEGGRRLGTEMWIGMQDWDANTNVRIRIWRCG